MTSMLSRKLNDLFDVEKAHGVSSPEFARSLKSLKLEYNRETRNILSADHGKVYAVSLTKKHKETLRIIISNHAIDRASQRVIPVWERYRKKDEGLATWLHRMAMNWIKLQDRVVGPGFHDAWKGMRFAFAFNGMDTTGKLTFTMTTIVEA